MSLAEFTILAVLYLVLFVIVKRADIAIRARAQNCANSLRPWSKARIPWLLPMYKARLNMSTQNLSKPPAMLPKKFWDTIRAF